ncbi:MAG: ABC transporter ATP-binding protein [Comamonas sp. SCN 65-56]|uniref:ABC transporter ATP-binding protein n=1 Tax=Comamonas sp. SCN 65-56 TaxID=1660095 RepID=UPI00086AA40B|nr:ABC transporter ATP-binding protein [Comamonas sp. SCN 65-56]ODS93226.1 MAG: ABC transporter ATP-binding protein [Comamonas sp. SCN 65-56]
MSTTIGAAQAVPLLDLRDVSRRFGALRVVDRLSLQVTQGEALGVIGPNGAGKTTLMNLIAGDVPVNSGQVVFAGRDVTDLPPQERCRAGIARSYQVPHPFVGLTVYENVLVGAVFGADMRESAARAHVAQVLQQTGLAPKADRIAGALPLLDRKRLELARALATRPRLLLLDEIAGGLTDQEVRELLDTIRAIRAAGVTIIWIEHIVHALLAVVDRLVALDFGRKVTEDEPQAVMADPAVREIYMGIDAAEEIVP